MGRQTTPKYRIVIKGNMEFTSHGTNKKMNDAALEQYRKDYNKSFNKGGVNYNPGDGTNVIPHISRCTMIEQASGRVVATAVAPMFEVV